MILKKGSKGKEVGNWQKFLNTIIQSLFNQHVEPLKIDEDFGEATKRITKRYQFYRKLDADGIVGKDTTSEAIKDGFKPMEQSKVTREITEIILHITANGNGLTGQELFDYIDKMHDIQDCSSSGGDQGSIKPAAGDISQARRSAQSSRTGATAASVAGSAFGTHRSAKGSASRPRPHSAT